MLWRIFYTAAGFVCWITASLMGKFSLTWMWYAADSTMPYNAADQAIFWGSFGIFLLGCSIGLLGWKIFFHWALFEEAPQGSA